MKISVKGGGVLILVVVDDSLVHGGAKRFTNVQGVLILVVVDDSLVLEIKPNIGIIANPS